MAKLYFYYSAMNAGKSTMLLQSSHNYSERGMRTLLLIPAIGARDAEATISTRIGLRRNAVAIDDVTDLLKLVSDYHAQNDIQCVLVDEAQFLTKQQVRSLARAVDHLNIPALCYGLRTDFQAEAFPGSAALLAIADELVEIKTICHCGRKATMNMRVDAEGNAVRQGEQVMIGGNESYVSTCRRCFTEGKAHYQAVSADSATAVA